MIKPLAICFLFIGSMSLTAFTADAADQWRFYKGTKAIDDTPYSGAYITIGSLLNKKTVEVRCTGNELFAYVDFSRYLDNERVQIRYRINKREPVDESWLPSAEKTAVFANDAESFALLLVAGNRLVFEATNYQAQTYTATFPLRNSAKTINRVLTDCKQRANDPSATNVYERKMQDQKNRVNEILEELGGFKKIE